MQYSSSLLPFLYFQNEFKGHSWDAITLPPPQVRYFISLLPHAVAGTKLYWQGNCMVHLSVYTCSECTEKERGWSRFLSPFPFNFLKALKAELEQTWLSSNSLQLHQPRREAQSRIKRWSLIPIEWRGRLSCAKMRNAKTTPTSRNYCKRLSLQPPESHARLIPNAKD